ncbi:hypothetical protein [Streptomyces sp. 184]|uniref:hypothetical protein n=1 Tax=Streptomyces sp. 184 TaxID=1827526 RepID=UPI0038925D79
MTIVLSVSVVVTAVLVFLLLGSQIEMYRLIEQIRKHGGLVDRPQPIEIAKVGEPPSSAGLPAELDSAAAAIALLLSDKCANCRSIAASLDGSVPPDVLLVIAAQDPAIDPDLTLSYDLDPNRTIIDPAARVWDELGINTSPVAVVVKHGRLTRATTVPSTRQLDVLRKSLQDEELHDIGKPSSLKGSDPR